MQVSIADAVTRETQNKEVPVGYNYTIVTKLMNGCPLA